VLIPSSFIPFIAGADEESFMVVLLLSSCTSSLIDLFDEFRHNLVGCVLYAMEGI
jgi:hypothetical protein